MSDVVQLYVDALAEFGTAVQDVADHEWDLPTPSTEWNVHEVVAHVVFGEAQIPLVLAGELTTTHSSGGVELLGSSPIAAWRGTALKAIQAAKEPGAAERTLELDMGTITGERLLGYRITDNIVHGWDVRVAVGRPEPIEDRFADWLLDFWQPVADQISAGGRFAPATEPATDRAGDRLLALLGRTPPPR